MLAQEFSIEDQSFSFGASEASGGAFSIVGSLQQSDPIPTISGGDFSLEGGFANVNPPNPSTSTESAPSLSVNLSSGKLELHWPSKASEGFVLEESITLGPDASWSTVGTFPGVVDNEKVVILLIEGSASRFFRLRRP